LQGLSLNSCLHCPWFFSAFGPPCASAGVGLNTVAVAAVATNAVIASITTIDNFEFIPEDLIQIIKILGGFSRCFLHLSRSSFRSDNI
jgi:hypothetical protein